MRPFGCIGFSDWWSNPDRTTLLSRTHLREVKFPPLHVERNENNNKRKIKFHCLFRPCLVGEESGRRGQGREDYWMDLKIVWTLIGVMRVQNGLGERFEILHKNPILILQSGRIRGGILIRHNSKNKMKQNILLFHSFSLLFFSPLRI